MKNLLLCGVAISTISAAYPAFAADDSAIQLGLGGYFKGYVSYVSQDDVAGQSARKTDILRNTEVHFNGKKVMDNGVTIGVQIDGTADGDDGFGVDESYIFASGEWGKVNFGRSYGSAYLLQVVAPAADSNIDGRVQFIQPINYTAAGITGISASAPETDYDQDVSAKYDKITYISPVFSGLQAGVTYTPESDTASRGGAGNASDTDDTTATSDIWDVALRYENKISDTTSYRVGAGYTKAQVETGANPDRAAWNVGLDFDIGAFGIGAAYQIDDLGDANNEVKYTAVGVDYTDGDMVYGASYYNKDDAVNTVDLDRYSVGATYKLIPGMSFRGSVGYYDVEDVDSSANATAVLIGTDIKF